VNVEKFVGISQEAMEWWEALTHKEGTTRGKRKRASERSAASPDHGKEPAEADEPIASSSSSSTMPSRSRAVMLADCSPDLPEGGRHLSRWEREALSVQQGSRRRRRENSSDC
jgi:hypothetical protein